MGDAFFPPERPTKGAPVNFCRWMQAFYDYVVNSMQFQGDGKYIAVQKTQGGNLIEFNPAALSFPRPAPTGAAAKSAGYNGPFKLLVMPDNDMVQLAVINGADDKSATAGIVSAGGQNINVEILVDAPENSAGFVILTVTYEYAGDAETPTYAAEITLETAIPAENNSGVWSKVIILGSYKYTAKTDTAPEALEVVQTWTGGNINLTDRWT